ncbi:MAG: hypothetical protein L6R37_005808 [Teloschistes peruensis]|nr:MAG: hypothetical protein L6R37_005808 [Teloschistes peruensis]
MVPWLNHALGFRLHLRPVLHRLPPLLNHHFREKAPLGYPSHRQNRHHAPLRPTTPHLQTRLRHFERLLFATLSHHAPALVAAKDIDCPEQLELHWACRHIPPHLPFPIDRQALSGWIPNIGHHTVHRNRLTGLAAIKTIFAAAALACSLDSQSDGRRLAWLAGEMDAVRLGMVVADALTDKHLPLTTKHALEARLLAALNTANRQQGHHYYHHHRQQQRPLSEEVRRYSQEDKIRESPDRYGVLGPGSRAQLPVVVGGFGVRVACSFSCALFTLVGR